LEHIKEVMNLSIDIKQTGIFLFNCQMVGMLVGGILWGIWGDKQGRVNVLFGSIILYSLANIANAFTFDIDAYAVIRFIAGIGLAGELGAGITLVSESMEKEKRGYGTMIIVTFGALGAVAAGIVGTEGHYISQQLSSLIGVKLMNWQVVYLIGGFMGLALLALRVGAFESGMFSNMTRRKDVKRGDIFALLKNAKSRSKYINCILIGLPVWFVVGVLIALSQDVFAPELGIEGVLNGKVVMYAYIGLSVGDLFSGLLSQVLKSRKKVVYLYLLMTLGLLLYYVFAAYNISKEEYYLLSFLLGFATGYWAIFVTIAAEQFGTNIRSTVTNTVPNFVRGAVLPITMSFTWLASMLPSLYSALAVGIVCLVLAGMAAMRIKESFSEDLDYFETM
jgi:MFS family permease